MSVTLGLMLRFDSSPSAVALPPLQQDVRPVRPIIEAEKVVEITSTARGGAAQHNGLSSSARGFSELQQQQQQQQQLTYSRKGSAGISLPLLSGQLLNIYA